ncbi:MAG: hypothetical protein GX889_10045 [Clostridiales bacterium]|nr:hypothetical protein [Clostridiales bacterium]
MVKKDEYNYYKYIIIYIIIILGIGYFYGYINITEIEKYYVINELTIKDIFIHNMTVTIINIFFSIFGGVLSIISVSFNLVGIGYALREAQVRLNQGFFNILFPTLLHGIGEFLVMILILNISIKTLRKWYDKIFNIENNTKYLYKEYIIIIILSIIILFISSVIEILISQKIFEQLYLIGGK